MPSKSASRATGEAAYQLPGPPACPCHHQHLPASPPLSPLCPPTTTCSCLVPDLYKGKVGVDKEEASHMLSKLDWAAALEEIKAAVQYLRDGGATRVACIGFCMGGALSLAAAQHAGIQCAAPFYGLPGVSGDMCGWVGGGWAGRRGGRVAAQGVWSVQAVQVVVVLCCWHGFVVVAGTFEAERAMPFCSTSMWECTQRLPGPATHTTPSCPPGIPAPPARSPPRRLLTRSTLRAARLQHLCTLGLATPSSMWAPK